jgi:AmmeMemoRadiSam system protein A
LSGKPLPDSETAADISEDAALWTQRHGCFVSIKTTAGDLRGCIGTFLPTQPRLDAEIIANAVSASTQDPRFPPMREAELDGVLFSVDVLSEPEIVSEGMELDCRRYGVIVSKGGRRGLLLPDLPGVDSVERQLEIAARKGGIGDLAGAEIRRFTVDRYEERARGKG